MEFKGFNIEGKKTTEQSSVDDVEASLSEETRDYIKKIESRKKKSVRKDRLSTIAILAAFSLTAGGVGYLFQKVEDKNYKDKENSTGISQITKYLNKDSKISDHQKKRALDLVHQMQSAGVGDIVFSDILSGELNSSKIKNGIKSELPIEGFETIGIDGRSLTPILDPSLYPSGFIKGNIASINYSDTYGKDNDEGAYTDENNTIVFLRRSLAAFNSNNPDESQNFLMIITHEGAHTFDWSHRAGLSIEQRLEFFNDALEVFSKYRKYKNIKSDSSLESNTIGSLSYSGVDKNIDDEEGKKTIKMFMVGEWWAKLCSGYLEFPKLFETLASDEEKALINKWLLGGDKKFNNNRARDERHRRWRKIHDYNYKILRGKNLDAGAGFRKKR